MSLSNTPESGCPLTILVVEDHPDTAKYLRLYLERLGHTVRSAATMRDALKELAEMPCEVLLSDIGLPDGDGWDLKKRAQLPTSVYAIAMSGFGTESDRRQSKAAGFRHHLLKPFAVDQLEACLAEATGERMAKVEKSKIV